MGFAADITGTLAGLLPAQQAVLSGLAAPAAARPVRKTERRSDSVTESMTQAGELLPIGLIREAVQECLQESIYDATGSLYALMADDEIVQLLHKLMGRPGERETVGRSLQEVVDAFSALAAKDGQPEDVVQAIGRFTEKLKYTTQQLAKLRQQAAEQLKQGVGRVNELLAKIAETNRQITLAGATGAARPQDGETQLMHLRELAKAIDFSSFRREDGSVAVFTKQGLALAKDEAVQLVPTEAGIKADGIDIAAQLNAGAVHASLHNRDFTLPSVQSQLDTLAQTLQSRVNQLCNRAVGGADARAVYRGSRVFADPAGVRIGLAGGDCEMLLLREDGSASAQTTVSLALKQYRQAHGLPVAGPWPVGQVVAALNQWLARHLSAEAPARLNQEGRVFVDLPAGIRLAFRDSRCLSLQSKPFPDADKPLGAHGQLILTDGLGNEFSTQPQRGGAALSAQDSLRQVAAKLDRIEGLGAAVRTGEQGTALIITAKAGSDLYVEPNDGAAGAAGAAALLLPVPADEQLREDVAVNVSASIRVQKMNSRVLPSPSSSLQLHGCLIIRDLDGAMLAFQTPQPDWSLEKLAERLQSASDPRLSAAVVKSGNQFALEVAMVAPDDRFVIEGLPQGWQTSPRFGFAASGGELTLALQGNALGGMTIAAGSGLARIAEQIGAGPWAQAGIKAQLLRAGNAEILDVAHAGGLPLSFGGSAFGSAPGQIDLRYNLRDHLGLAAPAEQVVPGFANFFGLNDLFVAEPFSAFDSKAAIGVFATTAEPGTAAALALNPGLAADPAKLGAASTIRQISDLLCNALNIAEAGDLPRGSYSPAQYADAIVRKVDSEARNNQLQLTYHRALLDRLGEEKNADIDVNRRLGTLMTLQQTYHDATQLVAGLSRLNEQLNAAVH